MEDYNNQAHRSYNQVLDAVKMHLKIEVIAPSEQVEEDTYLIVQELWNNSSLDLIHFTDMRSLASRIAYQVKRLKKGNEQNTKRFAYYDF